jgi:hypothetical protein
MSAALPVIQLPDLVIDVMSSDERRQLALVVPAVVIEYL